MEMRSSRAVSILVRLKMEYTFVRSQQSFFGEPAHRAFLAVKLFLYQFSNVYHTEIKKAEPFVTYFNLRHRQAPCS
ncbi:hypothetical protein C801_01448 [Bacteroides uniformis dnLKV2]|uniref:Uncharacterized protein n=1 Tax=Bacteroides uniformis dnLKV2 TaxID=1235787 RepID=R9HWQ5_BACUN|nr:hypothetical protein C801_01448 [Bacteroides uniformis dnLKV2]